jgi:major membrane immunogen (membrane-anchored lipoprotein)
MKFLTLLSTTLICTSLLFTACANRDVQAKHSGFLKNYDDLKENDKLEGTRVKVETGADFTKYKNIYITPIEIVSVIPKDELTTGQKNLFEKITNYLTDGYKEAFRNGTGYILVDKKDTPNTLVFEGAISAVEVHFDDMQWYQFTPITLGITGMARATYVDGAVRILGEGRFYDGKTGKLLLSTMTLQKTQEISTDADKLVFKDVKPALDEWVKHTNENLEKLRSGIVKYQNQND